MDMQYKLPVISFCTLVECQFRECQPFAVLTDGKWVYSLENCCMGQSCQEKKKKMSQRMFHVLFYLYVGFCLALTVFFCCGLSYVFLVLKHQLRIQSESEQKGSAYFSTAPIYSIPGFSADPSIVSFFFWESDPLQWVCALVEKEQLKQVFLKWM